ncbi:class I SAM-dependent methyltransferase [Pinirhizobacter soli]|uniref:class I SAM-dependent methyltransferase n=1 Tax=Pinirhizobacter soli TaxID=2786953 RepID=UPI00202A7087|nr:class I SAM-dependent methyltransferase [Pinirhizobacter soli]
MNIDELMRKIHAEVIRRRPGAAGSASATSAAPLASSSIANGHAWEPIGLRLGYKDSYSVGDFVALNDVDFVETTYRILLRRAADPTGSAAALADLRQGVRNKVHILGDIRFSPEGRERCVHVDGLLLPYKLQQWSRRRFIGRPLAWMLSIARLPTLLRRIDAASARDAHEVQNLGLHVNALAERIDSDVLNATLESRLARIEQHMSELAGQEARLDQRIDTLDGSVNRRVEEVIASVQPMVDRIGAAVQRQEQGYAAVTAHLATIDAAINACSVGVASASAMAADARRIALSMELALAPVALPAPRSEDASVGTAKLPDTRGLDALYVGLEDAFRGTREDIKQRASHYLPVITDAVGLTGGALVVDLGCGRGEWLEVLTEQGIDVCGVDLNPVLLAECTGRGFTAVLADALGFLRGRGDGSLAAITAMHLAEHLDFETLVGIIDEARRVLAPGGALILETPNPENLVMSTHWFYFDPTHRNPLPPGLFEWLVRARGFVDVRIERLIENRGIYPVDPVPTDAPGAATINKLLGMLQAAPDYAIVARSFDAARVGSPTPEVE